MQTRLGTSDDRDLILGLAERLTVPDLPSWRTAADVAAGTRKRLEEALNETDQRGAFIIAEDEDGSPAGFAWGDRVYYDERWRIAEVQELPTDIHIA